VPILANTVSFLSQLAVMGFELPLKLVVILHWSASVIPLLNPLVIAVPPLATGSVPVTLLAKLID